MFNPEVDDLVPSETKIMADKLSVKVGTRIKLIDPAQIMYVEASGNYIGIVMVSGETIHTKETITHIEGRLPTPPFARVHRSFIVNIRCVNEIRAQQNGYELTLTGNVKIISGSTYRKDIRAQLLIKPQHDRKPVLNQRTDNNVVDFHPMPVAHGKYHRLSKCTHIRACAPGDEDALTFLGKVTFMETYTGAFADEDILAHCVNHDSPGTYRRWLENAKARTWMAETETCNAPVGYLVAAPPSLPFNGVQPDDLEIHRIYLLKHFQGGGLGKSLMTKAIQFAKQNGFKRILLGDYKYNDRATDFYQRLGFRPVGEYLCRGGDHDYDDLVFGFEI
ncbi:MAG: GNAT family N-acetyltransferase [Gammaproteobacteria bacterium]